MAELGFLERLREFFSSRRFMWILTITFGVLVVLYFLFVTFLFNPFEDEMGDTAAVVPREVDYFVRWKGAGQRFDRFPIPKIWTELEGGDTYRALDQAGDLERWDQEYGISELVQQLNKAAGNVPLGLSLEQDLLREVAFTGRGKPSLDSSFDGMVMLRVSFKVKAGVSFLGFGFVRNKLPASLRLESLGDDRYRLPEFEPFGFQDAYLTRVRDVLLLATSTEWLDQVRQLDAVSGQGSLGQASIFHDNVEARLAPGDQPVEMFLRWLQLSSHFGEWPAPDAEGLGRLLGRFFNTRLLRFISGYWIPGERFEGRFSGDMDLQQASPFQASWFEGRPLQVSQIKKFAGMSPSTCFFFGGVSGNPGRILQEMESTLEEDLRRILDEMILRTGSERYRSMRDILDELGDALMPGMYLALHPNDPSLSGYQPDPQRDVEDHDDTPVPLFGLMADLRGAKGRESFQELLKFFTDNAGRLGEGDDRAVVQEVPLRGRDKAISFASPAVPGTGEIVVLVVPEPHNALVISNSYKFIDDLFQSAYTSEEERFAERRKLSLQESFQQAIKGLDRGANLFSYLVPDKGRHWFEAASLGFAEQDVLQRIREAQERERPAVEDRLRGELFGGRSGLSLDEENQLLEAADGAMEDLAQQLRRSQLPILETEYQRKFLPLYLLDWLASSLRADRRSATVLLTGQLDLE
ncbi:MAG: hypothetical protein DWQ01_00185 [Planctomycetota bacterium]|nr:MAG: hypothetical protein DWQ01_00185 [Planctomycetota bacterium]